MKVLFIISSYFIKFFWQLPTAESPAKGSFINRTRGSLNSLFLKGLAGEFGSGGKD
jgi:hypothetical protein